MHNGNGKIIEYNGCSKFEGELLDGKRNGKGKEYEGNELKFEGEYLNGKRNGIGKEFYEGKLQFEVEYLNEERNGKGKEYFRVEYWSHRQ